MAHKIYKGVAEPAYQQGRNAAESDFLWCSKQVRKGISGYVVDDCNYSPGSPFADEIKYKRWHKAYAEYFAKKNADNRRKHKVPLPKFK